MAFADSLAAIERYPAAVKKAIIEATGTKDLVDLMAVLKDNRATVWDFIKQGTSELESGDDGHTYVAKVSRSAARSYNTSRLLLKFAEAFDKPMLETIQILVAHKVVSLSWSWTNLKQVIRLYDVPLVIAQHEITDGDPESDIGEVWSNGSVTFDRKEAHADTTR